MTDQFDWVPANLDIEIPSAARIYDYLLGGAHNFEADRAMAKNFLELHPSARRIARHNREFLRRAVLYMVDNGIRQFLDLGSGIPTVGNVHEVAQQVDPDCRVVYVDYDDVAVAHSELLLESNDLATVVRADLTRPADVLESPAVHRLIDFGEPVGLLMVLVMHLVPPNRNPASIVRRYADALAPGTFLALSHPTNDEIPEKMGATVELMKNTRDPFFFRGYAEIVKLFEGFEFVEPEVVPTPLWRPSGAPGAEGGPERPEVLAGVGRKP